MKKNNSPVVSSWPFHRRSPWIVAAIHKKKLFTCVSCVRCKVDNSTFLFWIRFTWKHVLDEEHSIWDQRFSCQMVSDFFLTATRTYQMKVLASNFSASRRFQRESKHTKTETSTGHDKLEKGTFPTSLLFGFPRREMKIGRWIYILDRFGSVYT